MLTQFFHSSAVFIPFIKPELKNKWMRICISALEPCGVLLVLFSKVLSIFVVVAFTGVNGPKIC